MAKFEEAANRYIRNMFVCRNCKSRRRAPMLKVIAGKVGCRNCNGKALRPVRKK